MEEKINQALVQLENDLQDLVSAREQVEATVKASSELQKVVGEYVGSIKALCVGLQAWENNLRDREMSLGHNTEAAISNVKKICEEIVSTFDSKTENIKTSFQNGTKDTLDKFIEQNNKLAEKIGELTALREQIKKASDEIGIVKGSLEKISKELEESQDEQDKALEEIKNTVLTLPVKIQQSENSVTQAINSSEQTIVELLSQTSLKIDNVSGKADTITSNIASLTDLCKNISSSITSSTATLTTAINKVKDEIAIEIKESRAEIVKSASVNRWLMIAGFIIIAILLFILRYI